MSTVTNGSMREGLFARQVSRLVRFVSSACNEEANLPEFIRRVRGVALKLAARELDMQLVITDDHSMDITSWVVGVPARVIKLRNMPPEFHEWLEVAVSCQGRRSP